MYERYWFSRIGKKGSLELYFRKRFFYFWKTIKDEEPSRRQPRFFPFLLRASFWTIDERNPFLLAQPHHGVRISRQLFRTSKNFNRHDLRHTNGSLKRYNRRSSPFKKYGTLVKNGEKNLVSNGQLLTSSEKMPRYVFSSLRTGTVGWTTRLVWSSFSFSRHLFLLS